MTEQALARPTDAGTIEQVIMGGDLSRLDAAGRMQFYQATCKSLGLNPLTRPFDYITLNGKLTLYAKKDAADQLRKINQVSIDKPEITFQDDLIIVNVSGYDKTGRKDAEIGVVRKSDMRGDMANALMKAVTKAKRRLTLSICGLGFLDETEVETIPDAVIEKQADSAPHWSINEIARKRFHARWHEITDALGLSIGWELLKTAALEVEHLTEWPGTEDQAIAAIREYCKEQAAELGTQKMV